MPKDRPNTPGSVPERRVGFASSDGRLLPDDDSVSSPPLEQRLRTGAGTFQFDALINGVSTLDQDSPYANSASDSAIKQDAVATPSHPTKPVQASMVGLNRTLWISALTSVCVAVLTVFFLTHHPVTPAKGQLLPAAPGDMTLADVANPYTRRGMPDPALSPGAVSPGALNLSVTASVAVPDAIQRDILTAYGINPDDKRFLISYVVPPSLNGTNDAKNLFPVTPWFRGLKRRLDAHLTQLVLQKKMTLAQAQEELTSDWIQAVHRHPVRNYGYNSPEKATRVEKSSAWGK